jgi:hypothetical protein
MVGQVETETQEEMTVTAPRRVIRRTKVVSPNEPVVTESPTQAYQAKKTIFRTYQVIWYILGVLEVILGFRVLLKLLGANPYSGFTNFVYMLSEPFVAPFYGVLRTSAASVSVLEWSTLLAMVVYLILAVGLVELFQLVKPTNPQEVEENV